MKTNTNLSSLIPLLALLTACTSTGPVGSYNTRFIDRPYTLPKGVASWGIAAVAGYVRSGSTSVSLYPIPIPLFWEESLSDSWTLEWTPLPFSARYQISRSKKTLWGLNFGVGFDYTTDSGFIFSPSLGFYNRTNLGADWAWKSELTGTASFASKSDADTFSSLSLLTGPVFQLTDQFALGPIVSVMAESKGYAHTSFYSLSSSPTIGHWLFPLGAMLDWRIAAQWDLFVTYSNLDLGNSNIHGNLAFFDLRHLW